MILLHVVVLATIALGIVWAVAFCVRATLRAEHLYGVLSFEGMNKPGVATENFIETVRHAKKSLIIHDDGNDMSDSVYNDQEAIDAVVSQMSEQESLRVKCWFNVRSETELGLLAAIRKEGHLAPRFEVRYRKPSVLKLWHFSWFDPHYKIADGGQYGTVSKHAFEARRRRFRIEDCVRASEKGRDITFGPYMRDFDKGFGRAMDSSYWGDSR